MDRVVPPELDERPASGIESLLLDLAQLALRAGTSAGSGLVSIGPALLDRLIAACHADGGALLLVSGLECGPHGERAIAPLGEHDRASEEPARTAHILALHAMTEGDAWELVAVGRLKEMAAGRIVLDGGGVLCAYRLCGDALGTPHACGDNRCAVLALRWHAGEAERVRSATALLEAVRDAIAAVFVAGVRAAELALRREVGAQLSAASEMTTDWEQTFDAISDPVAILTPDYRVVRANAAYLRAMGSARGQLEGRMCFAHMAGQAGPCLGCPLPHTAATGQPGVLQREHWVVREDGTRERRVVQTWTYPVADAQGRVVRVVEILKDVTAQEEVRRVQSRAAAWREAERLKADLLGTVSHELRSPLAAIKGYADTLMRHERQLPATERREFLCAISESSDRLERVIDQMLEMSQLETGAVHLERMSLDADQLARDALRAAERLTDARTPGRFAFHLHGQSGKGTPGQEESSLPQVPGDPARLREVLDRLLENAIRYSPEGGEISVEVHQAPEELARSRLDGSDVFDGVALELVVRDTGQGIPQEHLGRVFERFHRVDTRLTREVEGLGLGLAIAKRIVELHRGAIWAESEPDAGSAFHVLLPATPGGSDAQHDLSVAAIVTSRED